MLKQAEGSASEEGPDFIATMHAVPATHIVGSKQKQHGGDRIALLSIGPDDGDGAALQLPVPTAFGMWLQSPTGHKGLDGIQRRAERNQATVAQQKAPT